ncbi:G6pd5p [Orobanche gracilis]
MEAESTIGWTPNFELLSQKTKEKIEKTLENEVRKEKGEKRKYTRTIYNRCYPNVLIQYFKQMKTDGHIDRLNKLKSLGFFAMTQLKITKTHNKFITWVCENCISSQLKIRLEGDFTLTISENDLHRVYKLPRGPRRIDSCSKEEMDVLKRELGLEIGTKSSELVNMVEIQSRLPSYENDETWQKAILLVSIGYLLCPSKNGLISLKYDRCLSKLDEVCEYNWCEHVLQHLQRTIKPGTMYPNGDIHFLMVHVMDKLQQGDLSTSEPTCMKWSNDQMFHCFDKIAKGKGFGHAIAKKSTKKAESSNQNMHSDYSVGVGNPQQMPSARSCISLEQCRQHMDYCKYNITAWTNCLQDLKKKEKELLQNESGQSDTIGARLKKRKKSFSADDIDEEMFTKTVRKSGKGNFGLGTSIPKKKDTDQDTSIPKKKDTDQDTSIPKKKDTDQNTSIPKEKDTDLDMEDLFKLVDDCDFLQDDNSNQDQATDNDLMMVVWENNSEHSLEDKRRPKRKTKESKFKRTPYREKIKITLPPFAEYENELLSYAFDKSKNQHEVLFQINREKRFNLDRQAILTLENKNFISTAIIDNCSRAMNAYGLEKGECKRLALTIAATTSMIKVTKRGRFVDKRTKEQCIAWFVETIESSLFLTLDDFKSEDLEYPS